MPRYKIVLEAGGPLLLGDSLPVGNVQRSRPFVAGSVLRGSLAKAILSPLGLWRHSGRSVKDAPMPEAFRQVFLLEEGAFGFLYPVRQNWQKAKEVDAFPLPLTAQTCKSHKGFKSARGHGVFDRLLHALRREAGRMSDWLMGCPEVGCGERLERLRGYGVREKADDRGTYEQTKIGVRTFVRVGLNRLTETAEERILYTLEALVPGSGGGNDKKDGGQSLCFVGHWRMAEDPWQALMELLAVNLPAEDGCYSLCIGTARSRGMGRVRLHLLSEPSFRSPLKERLEAFQLVDKAGQWLDAEHVYFALTLRSPLLLFDTQGRPTTDVTPELLENYVGDVPGDLESLRRASVIEQETWSGWSAAWGLPKPVTPAIAAGSVLAFRAPQKVRTEVETFLGRVEEEGLGERRAEGWGEVVACDPFHIVFDPMGGEK